MVLFKTGTFGVLQEFSNNHNPHKELPSKKWMENESITMDFHHLIASLEENQSYLSN